jgi:3-oxoacyl-[acyl-carrier protein] reductase
MLGIDLSGKTALVTGAGQGLGASTAALLARAGAAVIVNYFDDPAGVNREKAEKTAASIGPLAVPVAADVRDRKAVAAMCDLCIERFGRLDIVVCNAGIIRDKSIKKLDPQDWQAVIDTNLTGTFFTCQEAAARMVDHGHIVTLSSISAVMGFFGQTNYAASKAGVIGLTRSLSRELARRAITVNAVAPGVVLTEMGRSIPEEARAQMLGSIPMGRFGEPEEIAKVVLFLCSDLASYVTGQLIQVNGGWIG